MFYLCGFNGSCCVLKCCSMLSYLLLWFLVGLLWVLSGLARSVQSNVPKMLQDKTSLAEGLSMRLDLQCFSNRPGTCLGFCFQFLRQGILLPRSALLPFASVFFKNELKFLLCWRGKILQARENHSLNSLRCFVTCCSSRPWQIPSPAFGCALCRGVEVALTTSDEVILRLACR